MAIGHGAGRLDKDGERGTRDFADRVFRDKRYKVWLGNKPEITALYDLKTDPLELHNLLKSTKAEHLAALKKFRGIIDSQPKSTAPLYRPRKANLWDKSVNAQPAKEEKAPAQAGSPSATQCRPAVITCRKPRASRICPPARSHANGSWPRAPMRCATSELIAILLRTGTQGLSAIDVAQSLLTKFGSSRRLRKAPVDELRVKGVGRDKAVTQGCVQPGQAHGRRVAPRIAGARHARKTGRAFARNNRLRRWNISHGCGECQAAADPRRDPVRGTLDSLVTHSRDVFRPTISANASAVFLAHNHPSGDPPRPRPTSGLRATSFAPASC